MSVTLSSIESEGFQKGWNQKKINRKTKDVKNAIEDLENMKAAFDNVINDPNHCINYTTELPKLNINFLGAEDIDLLVETNMTIMSTKGDHLSLVHATRHGQGFIKGEFSLCGGSDYMDEYEVFTMQGNYDDLFGTKNVEEFIKAAAGQTYPDNPDIQKMVTLKDAIEYFYVRIKPKEGQNWKQNMAP